MSEFLDRLCEIASFKLFLLLNFDYSNNSYLFTIFQWFTLRGTDMTQQPCVKETLMNTIGGATIVGVVYNFATSRNPTKWIGISLPFLYFGT